MALEACGVREGSRLRVRLVDVEGDYWCGARGLWCKGKGGLEAKGGCNWWVWRATGGVAPGACGMHVREGDWWWKGKGWLGAEGLRMWPR